MKLLNWLNAIERSLRHQQKVALRHTHMNYTTHPPCSQHDVRRLLRIVCSAELRTVHGKVITVMTEMKTMVFLRQTGAGLMYMNANPGWQHSCWHVMWLRLSVKRNDVIFASGLYWIWLLMMWKEAAFLLPVMLYQIQNTLFVFLVQPVSQVFTSFPLQTKKYDISCRF